MKTIQILHLENNGVDAELVEMTLKDHNLLVEIEVVDNKAEFIEKIKTKTFDLILMDYDVPNFSASEAISITKERKITTPIIVISGAIGYEVAISLIKQGAQNYVLKEKLGVLPSVIERALHEQSAEANTEIQRKAFQATQTGIFKMNTQGVCSYANKELSTILGYSAEELTRDRGFLNYLSKDNKPDTLTDFYKNLESEMPFELQVKLITQSQQTIWVKCNFIPQATSENKIEFLGTLTDITELKKTQEELLNLSTHDVLTGLPNRRYFSDSVQTLIAECKNGTLSAFAVFYIDLDHFKKINDVLGHHSGDELLKQAAQRFRSNMRQFDTIARIGGDEFLAVFKHIGSLGEIAFIADNLLSKFRSPFYVNEHECLTTLSIGVAYVDNTSNDIDAQQIIQKADQALYRAKARGRNCYEIYTDSINHEIQHTLFIENALRHAIDKNEFSLAFQPQIDVLKNVIYGFEVLLRWNQSVYGNIPPSIFLPIAEESGQINAIGEWVIDHALTSYKQVKEELNTIQKRQPIAFSINVSAVQLLQDDFLKNTLKKIKSYEIDPDMVAFEITETSILQNIAQLKNQFTRAGQTELKLAVDDFGTGYSSFTNLKELPIRVLKIDRSFIQDIENNESSQNIVKSIISLGNAMRITVIAEGVEREGQVSFLQRSGCYIIQGYYFSKALTIKEMSDFVKNFSKREIRFE